MPPDPTSPPPAPAPDPSSLPPLSGAQMDIMHAVWDRREASVREVWETLSARRPVARNTVLTVMDRLAAKGWLVRRSVHSAHLYSAAVPRAAALGAAVRRLVEGAFAGSAEGLLLTLLEDGGVGDEEAARIARLVADARRRAGDGGAA